MSQTIVIETDLPAPAERVWSAMQHPASFLYVTRGLIGAPALAGRTDPFREGEVGTGWLFAFHVVPMWRHTIRGHRVDDATMTLQSHERGGIVRRWDHTLHVEPTGPRTSRYSDTVELDAGAFTPMVAAVGRGLYRYRQRRWRKLARRHLQ